jgi:sugar phosphate isomerase/epimerase
MRFRSEPTRRDFTKLALSALLTSRLGAAEAPKPDSKIAGVQLGINAPYSFGPKVKAADDVLERLRQLGLSAVELRTQPVEIVLGIDPALFVSKKGASAAETAERNAKITAWRKTVSMDQVREFRAKWESAGVLIEIVKVDNIFKFGDEEMDYAFTFAKAIGGRAISTEIAKTEAELKRLGEFADKHEFNVGYHGHGTTTPEHWEAAFDLAKHNCANVDLGHFVAGNNISPVPFIKKYHDRITHVHLKDRMLHNGPNRPFGEGDTPIAEVLRLIRDEKWNIQGTIEFEVKVPEEKRMEEIARSIQFCRDALA